MYKYDAMRALEEIAERLRHDPEAAHAEADKVLLAAVDPDVAEAYRRVVDACGWWASA